MGGDVEGLARYETLVDARDVERGNTALLRERGTAKITSAVEAISTTENSAGNLIFGTDYDLGDMVTVRFSVPAYTSNGDYYDMVRQAVSVNQRISEVTISAADEAQTVDLKYGDIVLSKSAALLRDVEQLKSSQ